MSDRPHPIPLSDIDASDTRYRIGTAPDDTGSLAQSIVTFGLVNPVLLRPMAHRYIIVSGFNRVAACIAARFHAVPAVVISREKTDLYCLEQAIAARVFERPLSQAEMIRALVRLSGFISSQDIAKKSKALFAKTLQPGYIHELIAIGQLGRPVSDLIESGRLSVAAAKKMVKRAPDQTAFFVRIFSILKASVNVQNEIILHFDEIAKRDDLSFETIARETGISDILSDDRADQVNKTRMVRECLYKKRFPSIWQARADLQARIRSLKLGNDFNIDVSANFEDPRVRFSFSAENHPQFLQRLDKLDAVKHNLKLKQILEP